MQMVVPCGNLLHNYGKSPFSMGKSPISMAIFHSYGYVCLPGGIYCNVGLAMSLAPPMFDGWNRTHKNGDEWGMVYHC